MSLAYMKSRLAALRNEYGVTVVYNGHSYRMTTQALEHRSVAPLAMEGILNIADADPRAFSATQSDFAANGDPLPTDNSVYTYNGRDYTISRVYPSTMGTAFRAITYRKPLPDSATIDTGTGQRKEYVPPANTH